jgi:hypothetical protein
MYIPLSNTFLSLLTGWMYLLLCFSAISNPAEVPLTMRTAANLKRLEVPFMPAYYVLKHQGNTDTKHDVASFQLFVLYFKTLLKKNQKSRVDFLHD